MNRLISKGRIAAMAGFLALILSIYMVFLYRLQIIYGEEYYNRSNQMTSEETVVTATRGNILDRTRNAIT